LRIFQTRRGKQRIPEQNGYPRPRVDQNRHGMGGGLHCQLCTNNELNRADMTKWIRGANLFCPTLPCHAVDMGQNTRQWLTRGEPIGTRIGNSRTDGQRAQRVIKSQRMLCISPKVLAQRLRAPLLVVGIGIFRGGDATGVNGSRALCQQKRVHGSLRVRRAIPLPAQSQGGIRNLINVKRDLGSRDRFPSEWLAPRKPVTRFQWCVSRLPAPGVLPG
jgi:hypothetical protein